jgi:hypothetical protein
MKHHICPVHRLFDGGEVPHVSLDELNAVPMPPPKPIEVLFHACAPEVVEQDHFVAVGQEPICQICADEADATGNEYAHFYVPIRYLCNNIHYHINSAKAYLIFPESQ